MALSLSGSLGFFRLEQKHVPLAVHGQFGTQTLAENEHKYIIFVKIFNSTEKLCVLQTSCEETLSIFPVKRA